MIRWLIGTIAVLAGAALLFLLALKPLYLDPRAELQDEVETLTDRIASHRQALAERGRIDELIDGYVDQTLGGDVETVDHRLRTRLNRIGEHVGLNDLVVNTGRTVAHDSPARRRYRGGAMRELRERIDFLVHEGTISGEGAFDDILRLLHHIEHEPWIKRITNVRLDPRDNGRRFAATIRLETIFLPGRSPQDVPAQVEEPEGFESYVTLASSNPFRIPPPPEPEPETPDEPEEPEPEPDPPFPYNEWRLTGVIEGTADAEVWLRRGNSDARRLEPGESLDEARLLAVRGDAAEFELDDQRFLVRVGRTMNDREPVSR